MQELGRRDMTIGERERELRARDERIGGLEGELGATRTELRETRDALARETAALADTAATLEKRLADLASLERSLAEARAALTGTGADLSARVEELTQERATLARLEALLAERESELASARNENGQLRVAQVEDRTQLMVLEGKRDELADKLAATERELGQSRAALKAEREQCVGGDGGAARRAARARKPSWRPCMPRCRRCRALWPRPVPTAPGSTRGRASAPARDDADGRAGGGQRRASAGDHEGRGAADEPAAEAGSGGIGAPVSPSASRLGAFRSAGSDRTESAPAQGGFHFCGTCSRKARRSLRLIACSRWFPPRDRSPYRSPLPGRAAGRVQRDPGGDRLLPVRPWRRHLELRRRGGAPGRFRRLCRGARR